MKKPINSESLQLNFQKVYKDFFALNDLVLSWNFSFRLGISWVWHSSSQIRIKQKVPLKAYVWVRQRSDNKIFFWDVSSYDVVKNWFESVNYAKVNQESQKVAEFIRKFLDNNGYKSGLDITFLSETARWHWFSFSWTSWAILATLIFVLIGKVSLELLSDYENFKNSEEFKEIFLLGLKIEYISKYSNATWDGVMNTLLNSSAPMYFLEEDISDCYDVDNLWKISYEYGILTEKFDSILDEKDIPIDITVVYAWLPSESYKIEKYRKTDEKKFNGYELFLTDFLSNEWVLSKNFAVNKFINTNSIYQSLTDNAAIYSVILLKSLKELYQNWYDLKYTDEFISTLNLFRNVVSLVEWESDFIRYFNFLFDKYKLLFSQKVWICPIHSSKLGGWYLVIMKHWESRETLERVMDEIVSVYPNAEIEYLSYRDGTSNDWIKLEQYISQEVFSSYIQKDQYLYKDNHGKKYIWAISDIIDTENSWLLLDFVTKKIYLNGKKLSSKEIHSQNTTVEVLDILLDNIWEDIENSEFPISSYTKNKNDMLSKIVIPLIKLCEENFGEKLPLICKWWLGDFYMKLNHSDIKIWIIKKL